MALEEYVGSVILEIDGREFECSSLSVDSNTGRKPVKTMNSTGRIKGFSQGLKEHTLQLEVVIPLNGDIDWDAIEGAKVTEYPLSGSGGQRISYLDCFTTKVGKKSTVDNESTRSIEMIALRMIIE